MDVVPVAALIADQVESQTPNRLYRMLSWGLKKLELDFFAFGLSRTAKLQVEFSEFGETILLVFLD